MSVSELASLVEEIAAIARAAGEIIRPFFRAGGAVEIKDDDSPLTEADLASNAFIVPAIQALTPDIPIISEEAPIGEDIDYDGRFWLVDPLDGTKEFVAGREEFTVNIGLVEARRPILGILHVPIPDLTYAAAGPGTATVRSAGGTARAISARAVPAEGAIATYSRSHANWDGLNEHFAGLDIASRIVSGSALKFGLVAEGKADIYPRLGPTMEWDTAAGHAIVNAAGGSVRLLDGSADLAYGKPGMTNPGFLVRGKT